MVEKIVLHALVLTVGLWAVVWILAWIKSDNDLAIVAGVGGLVGFGLLAGVVVMVRRYARRQDG